MDGKIFHILPKGESESTGPYTQAELEEMLNSGKVDPSDFIFFPDLTEWTPLSEVFDFHKGAENYIEDGQDPEIVTISYETISASAGPNEDILYIAVQQLAPNDRLAEILQPTPCSVAITSERVCVISPKLIGDVEVGSYPFHQIAGISSHLNRKTRGNDLKIELHSGQSIDIGSIPEVERRRLIEFAEEVFRTINSRPS